MNAIATSVVNGLLSIKPLARFAKNRARTMMMDRAESLGVYWRDEVKALQRRTELNENPEVASGGSADIAVNPVWERELADLTNPEIVYPDYYQTSFHAYEEGNLGWLPAMEVDVAARAVHARIWPEGDPKAGINGDRALRESYHKALKDILLENSNSALVNNSPGQIVDLGASAGSSTFKLQEAFPTAQLTGVELSPYFVAVAKHAAAQRPKTYAPIKWIHAPAEATGLAANSADLVSACLVFHELPKTAAQRITAEAYRLVKPGGYFSIMDMNPQSEAFLKMPPYVLTLLKSTEPYLDQYFDLDMTDLFQAAGFNAPQIVINSPRHRTIVGQKPLEVM